MRILWTNHADVKGSGYMNLSVRVCSGLAARGHEIKVLGLEYRGEEVNYPFSVIPSPTFQDIMYQFDALRRLWKPEVFVCAFDLPIQKNFLTNKMFEGVPYVGIFPIESDPLCLPYAMMISRMTVPMVISRFGVEECKKFGIDARYFDVGIDLDTWRIPSEDEHDAAVKAFGFEDSFVVLTVADNQERKNLSRSMEIFADFHEKVPNSKYVMVTREYLHCGWELRDLARVLKFGDCFQIYERGMTQQELWQIYAASDVFLITPKAEGAGLPILEAMAVGLPVIGTDCTAVKEHLSDGRGFLIPSTCQYIDPFMNGNRYFADRQAGAEILEEVYRRWNNDDEELCNIQQRAFKYVEGRQWENTVSMMDEELKTIGGANVEAQPPQD